MSHHILLFKVQSLQLAIRASTVREVLGERDWVPVPGARSELPGVIGWGGRAVALLDVARLGPGLEPLVAAERRTRVLLVEFEDSVLAIPADWVSEVKTVDDTSLRARQIHDFPLARLEVDLDDAIVPLLDPSLLMSAQSVGGAAGPSAE